MVNYKEIFPENTIQGSFPECFAFSIHKAGSTLMNTMIQQVSRSANIPGISIPDIFFKQNISKDVWENDENIIPLITTGRIYYGFRFLPKILMTESLKLKEKKSVLLIRDPRDALVSQYFSFGGKYISHKIPDKNKESFFERLRSTSHMDIDDYVLHSAPLYNRRLTEYKDNLNFKNVLLFKYEEIFYDKKKFLRDIFMHFNISVESSLLDEVATSNDIRPEVEDISKHIRKGTPGDYVNKLRDETITKLNDIFHETCAWYGYEFSR